ncbi:MAG: tripartite tricarboxylate transporter substrate binding protein [Ramlibacter sp.]|uniref:Bug family tripartite tricarboxylate transporter substrate binding protein n=1 Tax=Ramlibacter sp. TaxID=1917967 RepID=UPI00261D1A3E|nr:tripartite tricarboxylate transporter substrate binding protein [Ramlibacter sp.]MDH4377945.1 tripartite tricarboxylate transporter substrate binding protein [Ramlibacter sp.]
MQDLIIQRRQLLRMGSAAAICGAPLSALASEFPSKRIRFVVPFPAAGIVDIVARALSDDLAADLGQPVVVEALPGAAAAIGTQVVAKADPDGHTWLLATISHVATPYLQTTPYHPVNDFSAVASIGSGVVVAVVPASLRVANMLEFVNLAKARPGALNYMHAGNGSATHLGSEVFKTTAGISMQGVPYKGLPPGVQDLAAGRVEFGLVSLQLAQPLMKSGLLRAIAISTPTRQPDLPDVPTFDEQGFGSAVIQSWFLLCVPSATPRAAVLRINTAVNKALLKPDVRQRLASAFVVPEKPQTPEQCQATLVADHQRIGKVIRDAKITPT